MQSSQTKLNQMARKYTRLRVDGWREEANKLLSLGVSFLEHGLHTDADRPRLHDCACYIHDIVTKLNERMRREMDDQGLLDEFIAVDLSRLDALILEFPRFHNVVCSQCGQSFGPGDAGFSHCSDHAGRPGR